mmetsp:Transcript_95542/g.309560  ORF Transcript_95542/g.309560 Transcript_95542/m.309560 type:complete len:224 (-) Transcript_95542:198-869(-)
MPILALTAAGLFFAGAGVQLQHEDTEQASVERTSAVDDSACKPSSSSRAPAPGVSGGLTDDDGGGADDTDGCRTLPGAPHAALSAPGVGATATTGASLEEEDEEDSAWILLEPPSPGSRSAADCLEPLPGGSSSGGVAADVAAAAAAARMPWARRGLPSAARLATPAVAAAAPATATHAGGDEDFKESGDQEPLSPGPWELVCQMPHTEDADAPRPAGGESSR